MDQAQAVNVLHFAQIVLFLLPYLVIAALAGAFGIGFACGRASK